MRVYGEYYNVKCLMWNNKRERERERERAREEGRRTRVECPRICARYYHSRYSVVLVVLQLLFNIIIGIGIRNSSNVLASNWMFCILISFCNFFFILFLLLLLLFVCVCVSWLHDRVVLILPLKNMFSVELILVYVCTRKYIIYIIQGVF